MINMRSQDIADISGVEVHIVGCGAIGSSVATQLTRLGADNFYLYDFDKVEIQNIGVSQYIDGDIGKPKVQALINHMKDINQCMEVVENIAEQPKKPAFLIDGRMGAEHYQQYIYSNITMAKYKKNWYSDEDSDQEPCTRKATSYCSNMSGSFIANSTKNIVMKQPYFKEISFNFSTLILDKKKLVS